MKKVISVLLALVMIFTITTVAFAEGEDAANNEAVTEASDSILGDLNLDEMPTWVVKLMVKLAAVVAKIVAALAKLGFKAGILDDLIESLKGYIGGGEEPSTEAPATPDPAPQALVA